MYYILEDSLSISEIASAWSQLPGACRIDQIRQQLMNAYWSGDFTAHCDDVGPDHWPDPAVSLRVMAICGMIPWHETEIEDDEKPKCNHLVGVPFEAYPKSGQDFLDFLEFPRDMVSAWCMAKGIPKPRFWFAENGSSPERYPGRPSSMERILAQLDLRAEQGRLESTVAGEARALEVWAQKDLPLNAPKPKQGTIENGIRQRYKALRQECTPD